MESNSFFGYSTAELPTGIYWLNVLDNDVVKYVDKLLIVK